METGKNFFSFFLTRRFDTTPTAPAGYASASIAGNAPYERGHILSECEQGSRRHPRMVHFSPMEAWRNWHTQET